MSPALGQKAKLEGAAPDPKTDCTPVTDVNRRGDKVPTEAIVEEVSDLTSSTTDGLRLAVVRLGQARARNVCPRPTHNCGQNPSNLSGAGRSTHRNRPIISVSAVRPTTSELGRFRLRIGGHRPTSVEFASGVANFARSSSTAPRKVANITKVRRRGFPIACFGFLEAKLWPLTVAKIA